MATLLARGQITIAAIKDGADGKNYWQQDVWVDLSPAAYDRNVWYPVVGEALPKTGFAGIKVVVNLNSGTKPSWSTHSQGFSVDFHIDTQASGLGVTPGETIIYSDNYAWCPVSPVSYKQLEKGSIPILYLRGGGRYRVFSTYNASWKIYKDGYTWEVDNCSQSAMPSNSRPTPEGHTLKGEKGDKGKDGVDGTDGKDAVSVLVENAPLVFDTNDDGIVSPDISKLAKVKIMRGNRNVSDECSDVSSRDDMCVNCVCGVTQENGYISVSVSGSYITKNDVVVDGVSQGEVSATSGYAVAQATYGGVTYFAQVPFSVNVAKFTGVVAFDNNGYKSQFKEVTNRLNDTATKDDLKKAESDFKQTAREISLSVSEKAMGRRNMLPGSALRRKVGEGWGASLVGDWLDGTYTVGYYGDQGILTSDGIGGSNCFKAKCYYDGNTIQYPGMRWNGSTGVRNVKIQSGKKYTISAWVKCDRTDMNIALECLWQPGEKTGSNERKGAVPSNGFYHYLTEVNTWTLITTTIDTTNAPYSYIEVNLFITHRQSGVTATAWFCRPMMEEGDTYNGWTPSPQDYDYIGGNLLDNTASLSLGGNLTYLYGTIIKNGYEPDINALYAKAPANSHAELVQFGEGTNDPIALSPNTDYIFSFWAKGTSLTVYAYRNNNNAEMVTEDCNGNFRSSTEYDDGNTYFTLTNQWKRYWVHWRTKSRTDFIPQMILLRTSSEAWIAKPKLEVGCTMTDWTEKRTDMVDRQALLATGIDITNGKITITANNTIVRDNNGTTIALFANGKINASLIDVKHLWAISEDGTSKVGYFGNDTDSACIIDNNTTAPLFVGGSTALMSNFYVTSNGKMVAKDAEISGTLKGVSGTFNELTDGTGKLSIGFQDNGFFIKGYTRFYNDVTIDGMLRSQGKGANYLALGVWARGTFGSNARLTLMCIDNHRYYYEGYDNTKRVQGSTLGTSDGAIDGHYPWLVSMRPVTSNLGMSDGEEDCEYYGASFDLVIIRTTSKSGYYKFTNCGYGKVFHVINGYDKQSVWIAYQGGWFELFGGMGITMAYLDSGMYTPKSTKAGAGFFILGTYDNNW